MNQEISIKDLLYKIAALLDVEIRVTSDYQRLRPENSEVDRLLCNNSKLKENTSWEAQYNLDRGLSETIDWIKNNIAHYHQDYVL